MSNISSMPVVSNMPGGRRFDLSTQQQAVVDWILNGTGSAFVEAVAGSGKTATLVEGCEYIEGRTAFAVFAKRNQLETVPKLAHLPNVRVSTFHSFGNGAWQDFVGGVRIHKGDKFKRMMKECYIPFELGGAVAELVSLAKQSVVGVLWEMDDIDKWMELIYHYDVLLKVKSNGNRDEAEIIKSLIDHTIECITWSRQVGSEIIDFDDMLWLPLIENAPFPQVDWFLGDEAQDTNPARRLIAIRMLKEGGRSIWVGDRNQCQPTGTIVSIYDSPGRDIDMPIEQLEVGMHATVFSPEGYYEARINRISSREYSGELVIVSINKLKSRYTFNHKCIVDFMGPVTVPAKLMLNGVRLFNIEMGKRATTSLAEVTREQYSGIVYSLDVDGGVYTADDIVTHNSIYGFTGADDDAVDQIIKDFNCTLLPLTVTFRCSKAATKLAQQWVPHIEAFEGNNEGSVEYVSSSEFTSTYLSEGDNKVGPGDGILCRNTRPLVTLAFKLLRSGIGCHVEGRDIGKGLITLATKWKGVDTAVRLVEKLEHYREIETDKLLARDARYSVEALNDRIDTLLVIMDGCETVSEIRDTIERLFKDSNGDGKSMVILSTVHKAKGREWDRVFILGFNELMPSKYARQEWQMTQEVNIMYVAATRAKKDLILTREV